MIAAGRVALAAAALVVCAWFALTIRQATSTQEARAIVTRYERPPAALAARAATLLDHAATLNPSTEVDLLRGHLAALEGRSGEARRLLLGVVRHEPENLEAWGVLGLTIGRTDPALGRRALAAVRRLSPRVPGS